MTITLNGDAHELPEPVTVAGLLRTLDGRVVYTSIVTQHLDIYTVSDAAANRGAAGVTSRRAAGGIVTGPGTPTSDSIPIRVSAGEYVVKAAAVEHYGVRMLEQLNQMKFAAGGPVRGGDGASAGVVNNFHITQQVDEVALAAAVTRRLNMARV